MRRNICVAILILALCLSLTPGALAAENEPEVGATAAVVMDYDTGEFYYEKDADATRPVASMTKIMSVYLVFEEIAAGRLSLDSYVTAGHNAAAISNDPTYSGMEQLREGESYQVDTLLRLIMTASCNGSVLALAEHIGGGSEAAFVERMNMKAEEMGIDAHYADSCGITDDGNAVTPRAMALLAKRIIEDYPQILEYSALKTTYFQDRIFESSNLLLLNDMMEGIDGLKTGTTKRAGSCFTATAKRDGRRIIAVVMNAASREASMSECRALLEYGFEVRAEKEGVPPVSTDEMVTFTGRLGVRRAEIFPDASITVPCQIACDQRRDLTVAAGWYLDGAPVPGFQNNAFRLAPERISQFTVKGNELSPGEHVLEFRCNTAGLPGVDQAILRCEILVLTEDAASEPVVETGTAA